MVIASLGLGHSPGEAALFEKMNDLTGDQQTAHDVGVAVIDDEEVRHAGDCGALHGNLSVARAANPGGEDGVEAAVSSDDSKGEIYRPKLVGRAAVPGAKLLPGRSCGPLVESIVPELVRDFAPLIGRGACPRFRSPDWAG